MRRIALALAPLALLAASCRGRSDPAPDAEVELARRQQQLSARLASASGQGEPLAKWLLPAELLEVSGLALTADGRLLAHNDERGRVFVLDPRTGVMLKQFTLGRGGVVGDFEAIAVSGSDIHMLTSRGVIHSFREGADGASVQYTRTDTGLGKECEFEGLAYEADSAWFLLPCKVMARKGSRDQVLIHRWRPAGGPGSTLSIPIAAAVGSSSWKELNPSDITIDPATGNYVMVAGPQKALLEVTPGGEVVRSMPLPGRPRQPEGVAITSDGILIVADEGATAPADITLYRWPPEAAPGATQ